MKQQILSLGKDSLIYGVGSVIIRFTGLLLLPLFTAYLSPEEFGVLVKGRPIVATTAILVKELYL